MIVVFVNQVSELLFPCEEIPQSKKVVVSLKLNPWRGIKPNKIVDKITEGGIKLMV